RHRAANGEGEESESDDEIGGVLFMGGKFAKGKKLSYKNYLKMWKARHNGSAKGAKAAYEKLHKRKAAPKKKAPKKKATKKRVAVGKPTKNSPYRQFLSYYMSEKGGRKSM